MSKSSEYFSKEQTEQIVEAIKKAELKSSAEIRVHVAMNSECENAIDSAIHVFQELKMHETAERNGVLIYAALKTKHIAIIGDKAVNEKVQSNFWNTCYEQMLPYFKNQDYTNGILKGLELTGEHLAQYFPRSENDVDELNNEVSFSN